MQTKTALVVDDSRVARLTLTKLLQAQGFEIVEQGSAEDALAWLQQGGQTPDIIFMDVMMPGIDGLSATKQIKAMDHVSAIPVVVCTGKDTEADLAQARESGAAAVLSKPPAADALSAVLATVAETVEQPETEVNETPTVSVEELIAAVREQLLPELEQKVTSTVSAVREQMLPELEQKVTSTVAAVQRQVEAKLAEQPSLPGLDTLSEMSAEVKSAVEQQVNELKQSLSSQAEEVVSSSADKAFDVAVENFGLREKLMVMLRSEGQDWLRQQQSELKETLHAQLKNDMLELMESKLEEQLETRIPGLVKNDNENLLKEFFGQQLDDIAKLKTQLNQQRNIALAAAVVAVAALIFAFV